MCPNPQAFILVVSSSTNVCGVCRCNCRVPVCNDFGCTALPHGCSCCHSVPLAGNRQSCAPVVTGPNGKPVAVPAQPGAAKPGVEPAAKPGQTPDAKEGDKSKSGEQTKNDSPEPKVIRRDESKDEESDPDELKAMVGEDGRVAFQFRNQPWVELVQWLAEISDQPLDWLELPADRVNMRSPGRYTVAETRDLFNRHLLARGYTMLEIDGGLTDRQNCHDQSRDRATCRTSMNCSTLQPHTFVRTSLDVGWLSAEKLAEELKPMISGNGKLTALKTTNRIEAMDAAVNLAQSRGYWNKNTTVTRGKHWHRKSSCVTCLPKKPSKCWSSFWALKRRSQRR